MNDMKKAILVFNGHDHPLQQVIGKTTVDLITVKADDIDLGEKGDVQYRGYTPNEEELIIFYRHDRKYKVLLGRPLVEKELKNKMQAFQGRLISTPALKSTRIHPEAPATPQGKPAGYEAMTTHTHRPSAPQGFENRPRITNGQSRSTTGLNRVNRFNQK